MRIKVTDYKTMIKLLKSNGFILKSSGKHEKWSNGDRMIVVPHKHTGFSRMLAERLIKESGINV